VASNGKISLRQAMCLFLVITFTPVVRVIPQATAGLAKQAAWLTPFVSFALLLPVIFALKCILNKYPDKSFTGILEVIFGRFVGKTVTFGYILFFIMLLVVNVAGISNKLVISMYPAVDPAAFILAMLVVVSFAVYKGGLTVITRMGEVFLPLVMVVFLLLSALSSQNIKLGRLTPISYIDIVPVIKASVSVTAAQAHLPILFLLSDYFNNKEKIGKYGTSTALLATLLCVVLLVTVVGVLGAETTANTPIPFMTTVRLISVFESIERIEPVVVMLWIFTDFLIISVLLISLLNMYRSMFNLSQTRSFIVISLIIFYFMAMMFGRNMFEITRFLEVFLNPELIIWGYVLPLIVFVTGKVRKLL
jgi:spore germination protein (amino acid permease)